MNSDIKNNNIDFFSSEAKTYEQDYWRTDEEHITTTWFTAPGASILVLGCGAGRTIPYLHKHHLIITAVDISPEMVSRAMKRFSSLCQEIAVMDATRLRYNDGSFDYVFFPFHGIDNLQPDKKAVLKEAARVLKPDGIFIFSSHNWLSLRHWKLWLKGRYASYYGLIQARSKASDAAEVREFFNVCQVIPRVRLRRSINNLSLKDLFFYYLPFFDKSLYFICQKPKK